MLNTERILNLFWKKNIRVYKVEKGFCNINIEIDYLSYLEVRSVLESLGGRINIIKSEGFVFFLGNIKKKLSLVIGGGYVFMHYILFIYLHMAVEVDVQQNIPPFEVRNS